MNASLCLMRNRGQDNRKRLGNRIGVATEQRAIGLLDCLAVYPCGRGVEKLHVINAAPVAHIGIRPKANLALPVGDLDARDLNLGPGADNW